MTDETQPKPTRRTFMTMTVAGAAIAGGTAGLTYLVRGRGEFEELEPPEPMSETGQILAKQIDDRIGHMLKIPEVTISKWVNHYEKHRGPWKKDNVSRKDLQNFLLSTDFFPDGDEGRPLKFVAYYDPYVSICYYPLRGA